MSSLSAGAVTHRLSLIWDRAASREHRLTASDSRCREVLAGARHGMDEGAAERRSVVVVNAIACRHRLPAREAPRARLGLVQISTASGRPVPLSHARVAATVGCG
jgi:hypothetical protein